MTLDPQVTDLASKIRLDWTPDLTGQGYRFYIDGVAVSRTFRPDAKSTTFVKPDSWPHRYGVRKMDVVGSLEEAEYPPATTSAYFVSDWNTVNNGQMKWPPWATLFQVGTPSTIDLGLFGGPGISAAPNGRAAVVTNPWGAGKLLRLEIRNSDPSTGNNNFQKEELGSYEPATWTGGSWVNPSELWILMEMYLPDEFGLASGGPNGYTNIMDLHPSSNSGVPALGLGGYSTTNIQLYAGIPGQLQRKNFIDIGPANRNRKLTVVIGANIATSGGWVEAWIDGVNTIPRFNVTTAEASESGPYFKQGLYKETASSFPNGGSVIYFGRTLIGKTKQSIGA